MKFFDKKKVGILLTVAILFIAQLIPESGSLSGAAINSMALFISAIVLWVCESFPMCISALALMMIMPYFGVMKLGEVWPSFGGSAFFFVMATFALTASIENSTYPTRFIGWLVNISKGDSKKLIYGFMIGAAVLSSIMSNMATAIMFISISLILIKANGNPEKGKSNFAKCMLIGVPAAANIGGFMTLAGTPTNIMGVELLDSMLGIKVSFVQWMVVGVPVGLLCTILAAMVITKIFKPEPLAQEAIEFYEESKKQLPPLTGKEKKTLIIIVTMFVLWILGSWISVLNTAVVAILGIAVMMLPGIDVLTWDEYSGKTDWNTCMVIGAVPVLVQGMIVTGASQWLVDTVFGEIGNWSWIAIALFVGLFACVLRNFIPTGVANFALLSVPIIQLAQSTGTSPTAMIMMIAFWCLVILVLPFDPIYLISYGSGYYKVKDTAKSGIPLSLILVVVTGVLIPLLAKVIGF